MTTTTEIRLEAVAVPKRDSSPKYESRRVELQRRAAKIIRRHFLRDFVRVASLVLTDVAVFASLGFALDFVRSGALLGPAVGATVQRWFPAGFLEGWQFGLALLVGLVVMGSYGRGDARHHGGRLFSGVALAAGLSLWPAVWSAGLLIPLVQFVTTLVCVGAGLSATRLAVAYMVSRWLPRHRYAERVILVGHPDVGTAMRAHARLTGRAGMVSVGWVSDDGPIAGDDRYVGHVDDMWEILKRESVDTVVLLDSLTEENFAVVFGASSSAGCRVLSLSKYESRPSVRPRFVWHQGVPFVELTLPSFKAQQLMVKRIVDAVGSFVGLIVLAPFLALVALVIKLDSPGPVLFSHERVGFGGRVFRLLKFRTMRDGADDEKGDVVHLNLSGDSRLFKIPNDPRVTRIGAFLRRWSIDELPQLWTVLWGDMSLVGPRPFFEDDLAEYSDHHFIRLGTKPGISGLWQVEGRSDVVDFEEVVSLDREYVERWSLWLDFKILARTIPAVFRRTGAY
jgi:exopolysaccharide biosynthesis polyprenyl glycosylphosphotransferase